MTASVSGFAWCGGRESDSARPDRKALTQASAVGSAYPAVRCPWEMADRAARIVVTRLPRPAILSRYITMSPGLAGSAGMPRFPHHLEKAVRARA